MAMSFNVEEITPNADDYRWDKYFLDMSKLVSSMSRDRSTQCGCVFVKDKRVLTTGYNGFTVGTEDYDNEKKHKRPEKYYWFEHSERNAIYNAARKGISLEGATAYVTGPPCIDCARGMIQCGIRNIIIPKQHNMVGRTDSQWAEQSTRCKEMYDNAGVGYYCMEIDDGRITGQST